MEAAARQFVVEVVARQFVVEVVALRFVVEVVALRPLARVERAFSNPESGFASHIRPRTRRDGSQRESPYHCESLHGSVFELILRLHNL